MGKIHKTGILFEQIVSLSARSCQYVSKNFNLINTHLKPFLLYHSVKEKSLQKKPLNSVKLYKNFVHNTIRMSTSATVLII